MSAEKIVLENGSAIISTTRIVIGGTTYPTANITAVTRRMKSPGKGWPIALVVIGIWLLSEAAIGGGLTILVLGILLLMRKATHFLVFSTAGNEVPVFDSKEKNLILELESAINHAIVARG